VNALEVCTVDNLDGVWNPQHLVLCLFPMIGDRNCL